MTIVETELFKQQRDSIVRHIANDKKSAALAFAKALKKSVNTLVDFPYKYKQSIYLEKVTCRDMVFKGYTIVYQVCEETSHIEIVQIFNKNLPLDRNA